MKKLAWTALVSLLTAVSAALSIRLADRLWRRVTREPPPEIPKSAGLLGRFLLQKPTKKGLEGTLARHGM